MELEKHSGNAGAENEAQIEAQVGKGERFFPLHCGGVIRRKGVIGGGFQGLKQ